MRILYSAALCAVLAAPSFLFSQEPGMAPEQMAPPPPRPTVPQPGRTAAAPLNRPAANSPAQAGRNALYKYLDYIAGKDEAARREKIAAITTREQAEARQKEVRAKILSLLGGLPEKTPLNAQVL